jgi:hypothetical protein
LAKNAGALSYFGLIDRCAESLGQAPSVVNADARSQSPFVPSVSVDFTNGT